LGIQSFSTGVLEVTGRRYDRATAMAACRAVLGAGFDLTIQLMSHLPEAREEDDLDAAARSAALKPAAVRVFPTVVLAGTRLETWWRQGRYRPASVSEAVVRVGMMLDPLTAGEVPVTRIGLQPSLSTETGVLAGPYHAALGELCWAEFLARRLARTLAHRVTPVSAAPATASMLKGHDGFGMRRLAALSGIDAPEIRIERECPADDADGQVLLRSDRFVLTQYNDCVRVTRG